MRHGSAGWETGGWGWLVLPLGIMFVGSNLWFGAFFLATESVELAARRTMSVGPLAWSVNQVLLLLVAVWMPERDRCP